MTPWLLVLAPLVLVALRAWVRGRGSADPLALSEQAGRTGDVAPLLAALHRLPADAAPDTYHRVIRRLWDAWQREPAATVARDFAEQHRDAAVAQYWLRRFLQDEPELAGERFDEAFLTSCYDAAVAASCGSAG